jgi:hypothetical protein
MKTPSTPVIVLVGTVLLNVVVCQAGHAQGLLNESGRATVNPLPAPTGGYGANPQEYLAVSWSVVENASKIYLYSYTVQNPAGDVLVTPAGGLTATPATFDTFSVDFNTTPSGKYLPGSIAGGSLQQVNTSDLVWSFNSPVSPGASAPTVSFQSDFAPTYGYANAANPNQPSAWASVLESSQEIPVPDPPNAVPEPAPVSLFALAGLLFLPVGFAMREKASPAPQRC